jgi:DNA-directed RNA polymerase specialized sigma24 family protein
MSALAPTPIPDHADDDATSADDARLLGAYIEHGSQSAFTELVRRHARLVYGVAFRYSGRPHTAEEIAQTVFIELSRQAARLHKQTVLPAWLHTVAHRRAIDAGRA